MLNLCEMLSAVNKIAHQDGGRLVGTVGEFYADPKGEIATGRTYSRQYLINVHVHTEHGEPSIRFGFAQSNLARAPGGGYPLTLPGELLRQCETADDVLGLWQAMQGNTQDRLTHIQHWLQARKEQSYVWIRSNNQSAGGTGMYTRYPATAEVEP